MHPVEGLDRLADLNRPHLLKWLYILAPAQSLGIACQLFERSGGAAEQQHHQPDNQTGNQHQVEGGLPRPAAHLLVDQ